MTRTVALILLLGLGCCWPTPVDAYLKFGVSIDGTAREIKWSQPIRYFISERPVDGVTPAQLRDAVGRAFSTWQASPSVAIQSEALGFTTAAPNAFDGRTTLGFLDRPDLDRVLAQTSLMLDESTGAIVEADIFFNTRFAWSTAEGGAPDRIDLESIALHEIGHLLGLGHSAIGETELQPGGGRRVLGSGAVMFPIALGPGSTADRVLQPDDVAGIVDLYGTAPAEDGSSIRGRVTKNGAPLFGAHVVAFNPETGALVGNFTLGANGEFVIAGLEPGPHIIRVEPLDDVDTTGFFVDPLDLRFQVTFAQRLVVAPPGGTSPEVSIEVTPR